MNIKKLPGKLIVNYSINNNRIKKTLIEKNFIRNQKIFKSKKRS